MGIVNVTPDSFSDGGRFVDATVDHGAAIAHGRSLAAAGADIVDVGGASSRPGADPVDAVVEAHRVVPVVAALAADGVVVSVDTTEPEVAAAALDAGAEAVNDIGGLRDPAMTDLVADRSAGVVVMHMQGDPATMQDRPLYGDVVAEVIEELVGRAEHATAAGVDPEHLCLDPGIGFGKTAAHNLELLARLRELTDLSYPVMVGASRKSLLGTVLSEAGYETAPDQRDAATAATTALAVAAGAALVRVHDVAGAVQTARVADAIVRSSHGFDRGR